MSLSMSGLTLVIIFGLQNNFQRLQISFSILGFLLANFSNDNTKDFLMVLHALPQSTQL